MALLRVLFLFGLSLVWFTSYCVADVIDLKDLPKEVKATITTRYPNGKLTELAKPWKARSSSTKWI